MIESLGRVVASFGGERQEDGHEFRSLSKSYVDPLGIKPREFVLSHSGTEGADVSQVTEAASDQLVLFDRGKASEDHP